MIAARIPASANIICKNGGDVLLIKRSPKTKTWPNFWAFPGGKVDEGEFFTEAWLRELTEEVGISATKNDIQKETIILQRSNTGVKNHYFALIENWNGTPDICEPNLATDISWFPIDNLPKLFIPHHKIALNALLEDIPFQEVDIIESSFHEA